MKNKLSKRVFSLFLSLLMVATSIPLTAVSASAAESSESGLVGSYLSKNVTDGISENSGNVTWDSTEGAAYFDGNGYLTLDGAPMSAVNSSTGFTISLDVKRLSTSDTMGRIFDFHNGSNSASFAFNGGADKGQNNDYERFITMAMTNSTELRYYANDFTNSSYCDVAQSSSWLDTENPGEWHNFTLTMTPSGQYSYYIDGTLMATFKSNYCEIFDSGSKSSVTPAAIMNSFSSFSIYTVGRSMYSSDPNFKGYIKNLKLYDRAVTITQAVVGGGSSDLATLKNAINEFESRMDGNIYLNMGNAYNAYVTACKAYDSYYYGNNTSVDIVTPASDLAQEILKMHKWIAYEGNVTGSFAGDNSNDNSSYVASDYYKGLAYSGQGTGDGTEVYTDAGAYRIYLRIHGGKTVAVYDGSSNINIPVMFSGKTTRDSGLSAQKFNAWGVYTTTSRFTLKQTWSGYDTSTNFRWLIGGSSTVGSDYCEIPSTEESIKKTTSKDRDKYYFAANVLIYDVSTNPFSDGVYYMNITPAFTLRGGNDSVSSADSTQIVELTSEQVAVYSPTYLINYYALIKALEDNTSALSTVSSYKEGGLSAYMSGYNLGAALDPSSYDYASDIEDGVELCAKDIDTAISSITGTKSADTTANYPALRDAFDYSGTIPAFVSAGDSSTFTVKDAYNNGIRKGFSAESYSAFKTAYENAQAVMSPVSADGYVQGSEAQSKAAALLEAFNALQPVSVAAPTITESTILGPNDTIVITNNETGAEIKYTIKYNDGSTTGEQVYTEGTEIKPFNGNTTYTTATVTAYASIGDDDSKSVTSTYTLYQAPSIDASDNQVITDKHTIAITSNNETAGVIQYSYDGTSWTPYTGPIIPFKENKSTSVNVYAREVCGNATSAVTTVTNLIRKATFGIYSSTGDDSFNSTSKFIIADADTYSDDIKYTLKVDGIIQSTVYTYDKENGISVSDNSVLSNAKIIEITAYAVSQESINQKVTAKFFNSDNYNPLAYRESFDGASVSGTKFTTGSSTGINGTLANADTASVVSGAGYVDGNGNSPDWRSNVLKINTNATAPGNTITFDSNPLADATNAAIASQSGVTISFWRHMEDDSGNTVNASKTWLNGLTFQSKSETYQYLIVETSGYVSRSAGAQSGSGDYLDVKPANQNITEHAAGNDNGRWVQIAITIDPENGVTVYANGETHDVDIVANGSFTGNNAALAQEILTFITDSNTQFTLCNGITYEGNDCNLFLDDIRIYSTVLSQVDINNMYVDKYADVQTGSSTGHDPTAVTVYTLTDGSEVGEAYVQKNGYDKVADIDYYIFGTGMTIYHSEDNVSWEVVGDENGKCGYQNEGLFGDVYTTALAEPLAYAATDSGRVGAGKLVWAPHVIYNINTNKWCYYGSTSSWGSQISAIFLCESSNITGPYTYKSIVQQSSGHPNAIDPAVYYNADYTQLYMVYGSWGGDNAIYGKKLMPDGSDMNAGTYLVCRGLNTGLETETTASGGSGEGAFVIYENGYYYLYVSMGQNEGNYIQRVFRSTEPDRDFVDSSGISATDNTTSVVHGNQILHSFDSPLYDYMYASTGHNSVYKTKNSKGEYVTVNSVHARPYANENHGWKALEDGAFSTRQVDLDGNVSLQNMIAYTDDDWPIILPYQYNGTDTVTDDLTASDVEGIYTANDMMLTVNYDVSQSYSYSMIAISDTEGISYGVRDNGEQFRFKYVITKDPVDNTNYIDFYNESDDTKVLSGVIGTHTVIENGVSVKKPQIGIVNISNGEHTMAYRSSNLPNPDAESLGDFVSVDSIIYTHKANDQYTKYGQEISDNFTYGQSGSTAERCTTIKVKYPYAIDTSDDAAVYCLSDEERCKNGIYTGSSIKAVDLSGDDVWNNADGTTATTAEVAAMSESEQSQYYKLYGMQGTVSNYFAYDTLTGKYTESGVELIITYLDVNTGNSYGEFEFCYVMPNPAWAHSIAAIRNQQEKALVGDMKGSSISFVRLPGSVGTSTTINSSLINSANGSEGSSSNLWAADGNGNFNYLSAFGNNESVNYDYTQPDKIAQAFNFYDSSVGTSSGSYYAREHTDDTDQAYGVAPNVVNADYYIDYSDTSNDLITRNSSGVPTGYKFELKASNMYWTPSTTVKGTTSVYRNTTGLGVTYSSTAASGNILSTMQGFSSPTVGSSNMLRYNRSDQSDVQSYFKDSDGNLQTAFPTYDNGYSATNAWNGTATFTGKSSVAKNTDTTSAETYANYIIEVGSNYVASNGLGGNWGLAAENYHYYNIGVNTCDKGATRYFAENVLGKTFEIDSETGKLTITGDLASTDYTVASYKEYLDAIADCYWFVENPYNTTYTDGLTTKEFTTAYDADGNPIFNTTTSGNNIFGDGTTTTDAVQAEKIQNVIEAYNNLFKKQDYIDAQQKYSDLVNQAEALKNELELNPDIYTSDTVSIFNSFVGNIEPCYTYYLDKDDPVAGEEYWRYTELSGSEYKELNEAIEFMSMSLMKRVDTSNLTPVIETKTTERDSGIYSGDVQIKSMGSWIALNNELNTANDYISQVDNVDANGFKVGKFAVTGTGTYIYNDEEYIYQIFDSTDTGATDANGTYSTEANFSDLQNSIYREDEILDSKSLADVDTESAYETFDYAADVLATLDSSKYTADGLTYITAILQQLKEGLNNDSIMENISPSCVGKHVYASSTDVETYNTVMGTSLPLDTKLRCTSVNETDPLTAALLTLVTELNTTYTVKFDSDLTILKDGVQQGDVVHDEKYYGEIFNYDVSSYVTDGYIVTWDVIVYDKDGKESSSEKISASAGPVINKVADTNVKITANIEKGTAENGYVAVIRDVYGLIQDIYYSDTTPTYSGDTITVGSSTYTAETYPNYDFSEWNEFIDGNVYTYKPIYIPQGTYVFKVQDGATLTGVSTYNDQFVASYDTHITVINNSIADFYAWAIKTSEGKYQVVSYSSSYSFYACADEEFVAITGNSTDGYMVDGQAVTASIIEDSVPYNSIGSITPDEFVTNKLTNKAPFVYIQSAGMYEGNTKARVYARYTEGCAVNPTNFGIIYKSGAVSSNDGFVMGATIDGKKVYTFALNTVLDSGQFVFTLNKATGFSNDVSFRAYINYNFDYTAVGETAQINAIDYSEYAVASLA